MEKKTLFANFAIIIVSFLVRLSCKEQKLKNRQVTGYYKLQNTLPKLHLNVIHNTTVVGIIILWTLEVNTFSDNEEVALSYSNLVVWLR